jgi:hypothetical protein
MRHQCGPPHVIVCLHSADLHVHQNPRCQHMPILLLLLLPIIINDEHRSIHSLAPLGMMTHIAVMIPIPFQACLRTEEMRDISTKTRMTLWFPRKTRTVIWFIRSSFVHRILIVCKHRPRKTRIRSSCPPHTAELRCLCGACICSN